MSRRAKVYALAAILIGGGISILTADTVTMKLILTAVLIIPVVIILMIKTSKTL